MSTKIVTINLDSRSYDIYIGSGLLYRIGDFVPVELEGRSVFIVTDKAVETYARQIVDILLQEKVSKAEVLSLTGGEQAKSFRNAEKVSGWLLDNGVARDSIIFAIGGGVIGDLTGFCASIILRGVPFVQVPTTLLSLVDSSVGGKTGINTTQGKNLVGSFYQPVAVIADIDMLKTLPQRELLAGYAEIAKYGLINDPGFFTWLESNGRGICELDSDAITNAIEISVRAKAAVVQADEREEGQRALLNLGHTFGHALEAAAGYDGRLLHGEAVAIGIVMAFDLSSRMELCSRQDFERVERHFTNVGLPTRASFIDPPLSTSVDRLIQLMGRDKKASKGKMRFILANGIGEAFIAEDVPVNLVKDVIRDSLGKNTGESVKGKFRNKGVKGLWKSAFSSHS